MYNLQKLISNIVNIYTQEDMYEMHKSVVDFHAPDWSYVWDYFNLFIQERISNEAPKLYHIWWPFDVISNKAPQRAICFQWWELLVNKDITYEVDIRTAAMNFVVFSNLWISNLQEKNILVVWTWKIAREFLKQLKEYEPWISHIYYNNHHWINLSFEQHWKSLSVDCTFTELSSLWQFDIIVLHTSSTNPIITKELFSTTKDNTIITTFAWSHTQWEVSWEIYTDDVQLVVDRDQTIENTTEIKKQITENKILKNHIITLKELIAWNKKITFDKRIIYRSTWAPMQTLAIVKMIS
jgi:ornithine cyclodeaminase/alanine dehydrogenase-like protein (mu-crystallin family)